MSYIDLLDKNKSIQAARHEMEHFSDLYKLHEFKDIYEIGSGTGNDSVISIINCLNYDAKEINNDHELVLPLKHCLIWLFY